MGNWTSKAHVHDVPRIEYDLTVMKGDVWTCECGTQFVLIYVSPVRQNSDYGTGKPYVDLTFQERGGPRLAP